MFAVIFEVRPRSDAWDEYLGHAASLRPELLAIDGFLENERYASLQRPGWLVSVSIWRDEKALVRWRTHALHHDIQGKGRSAVFSDYQLRVGEIVSDSALETPPARNRFDAIAVGIAKAATLTQLLGPPSEPAENGETFDSITRPGDGLILRQWRNAATAQTGAAGAAGRHRVDQIIRDYGMFARTEAPQYFPS